MEQLVTIFGGSGFIGRYVIQALAATGARLRVVGRDPQTCFHLKPLGALGQIQLVGADVRDPAAVARAVAGATAVVNLVGVLAGDFDALHVAGAANIARAATDAGVGALVHVSAIGANAESESGYGRSKGLGEAAVRAAFPQATILRPSIVFGPEDQFTNRFAALARQLPFFLPVVAPKTQFQPVYVKDVAAAIAAAVQAPGQHGGKTYELGGAKTYSFRALIAYIAGETRVDSTLVDVPDAAAAALANLVGWLPGAPITRDQWLMLQADNVVHEGTAGLDAFGIRATPLEAVAPVWLERYRPHGRFCKDAA